MASLRAADSTLAAAAWREGLEVALATALDTGAVVLEAGWPVVRGRDSALAVLHAARNPRGVRHHWRSVRVELSADGRDGYTFGYGDAAGSDTSDGRYPVKQAIYWRRGDDGRWRILAFVRSAAAEGDRPVPEFAAGEPVAQEARDDARREAWRRELLATDSAFAALGASGSLGAAFAEYAAPQGTMLGGEAPLVVGADPIRAAFQVSDSLGVRARWAPVYADVAASGDLGFTVGEAEFTTPTRTGTPRVTRTKYLTIWRRMPDGEWRYVVDGGNGRP